MYAVVKTGGKQYRVEAGSELMIERLAEESGASITFDRVLLVGDGETVTVGTPVVEGASVSGTVLGEVLGPKLVIFKFKQKATYRRKTGHRQHLTRVRIDEINASGKKSSASKASKAEKAEKADEAEATTTAEAPAEKPKRTRKPAAKASAKSKADEAEKPKRTRKPAARKAKAEE